MILYDLKCRKNHVFEAWFRDSATYENQVVAGEVRCPACGSKKVEKTIMAPRLANAKSKGRETSEQGGNKLANARRMLMDLRRKVEESCDYVGKDFAEEARKIHYGEIEERNIYGETSDEEARDLVNEGIKVRRIPWLPRENS